MGYLSTDEYRIVEVLRQRYPYWTFYTLTEPSEQGFLYKDFAEQCAEDKRKDLIKLFASMEVLKKSTVFIGTFSSNLGMFMRMCKDECYAVDYEQWLVW